MSHERPAAVRVAVWLIGALIVLSAVTAVLSMVLESDLVEAWEAGRADVGSVTPPSIGPVVLVLLLTVAGLVYVLLEFLRARHAWARPAIATIVVMLAGSTLALLRIGPPPVFVVLSLVSLVIEVAVLIALWHRDTTAYLRAPHTSDDLHV